MTVRVSRADMALGRLLASGAQGEVFEAPGLRMQYASSLVFKRYNPEAARTLDVPVLESMPAYLESLRFSEGMELLSMTAWPCRLVEEHGAVIGFVMPAIPDAFFLQMKKSSGMSREAAEFQHLLNSEGFLARRGISLSDRERYQLLREAAQALSVFHRHGIAVGDLSPKNLLFSVAPDPRVYFIDCDSMRIKGRSAMEQAETPDWKVRDLNPAEELATAASDSYKLGLLALRLLTGTQDARDPARLPSTVPGDIRRLTTSALSADPARRPGPGEWTAPLQAAARNATSRPPKTAGTTSARQSAPPAPARVSLQAQSATRVPPSSPATTPPHPRPRRRRVAVASAITMLAVTAIALVLARPGASQPPPAANTGTLTHAATLKPPPTLFGPLSATLTSTLTDPGNQAVSRVAFSPDGTTLAASATLTGTNDWSDRIYLWNTATGKLTATLTDPNGIWVNGMAYSPDGTTLAAGDGNGSTYLWSTATGKLTATLTDPGRRGVFAVAFSPDGATLAAGDVNGYAYLWDTATGKLTATLTSPGQGAHAVAFSPDGATLAIGDVNGSTYLWSTATGKLTATLTDPGGQAVYGVAFSPDGTTLAAGDYNGSTYLWSTATGKLTATLTDPGGTGVTSAVFAPGGTTLVVSDANGHAYLWDTATGKLTATLTNPNNQAMYSLAFSPDGTTLATTDGKGRTYLWRISKLSP